MRLILAGFREAATRTSSPTFISPEASVPEKPRSIVHFDASGPHSPGAHCLWFVDGNYLHMSSGAPDFVPTYSKDDQFYTIVDVRNPSAPEEVGRWWLPGTREGDDAPPPTRHTTFA